MKKKQKEAEGLRLTGSTTDQQNSDPTDIQEVQDQTDQGQGQDNPDSHEPAATSRSNIGQVVFSELNLIPFVQEKGEEVPDFSTIFYGKEKKRIVKRTERKFETGQQSGMMVTDKTLVYRIDKCP